MFSRSNYLWIAAIWAVGCVSQKRAATYTYNEPYRPQIHFSPPAHWMNDPNGMVYDKGTYHLFYQYYPDSTVWGPMHWGHATTTDLVHWQQQPVALYPDSLGYIFSGSAVVDKDNTSGFGKNGVAPLVAIFTHHDPKGEKEGRNNYQNQSLAYSLDNGKTWTKFSGNPVLHNTGIRDFRDPKVSWNTVAKKWIMTLATLDRITFFSSPDLKSWTRESEFGKELGAHGGVWECPDLFPLTYQGKTVWVLIVNINPGGPNGGSATQYFTGDFDGHTFTPYTTETRWLDYGPDEYAGVTWSNTGDRKIFLGWMSNWQYATVVPTETWRSAMTVPRDLGVEKIGDQYHITSHPVPELNLVKDQMVSFAAASSPATGMLEQVAKLGGPARLSFQSNTLIPFTITLSNKEGEKIVIGYDAAANQYFIDRNQSGKVAFEKGFAARHTAPRISTASQTDFTLIIDDASVELFADGGLSVMTAIFFPTTPYTDITVQTPQTVSRPSLQFSKLKSIWR